MKKISSKKTLLMAREQEQRERQRQKERQKRFMLDRESIRAERWEKTKTLRALRLAEEECRNDELYN